MCMNYFVDPYNIFHQYKYVNFSHKSQEFIQIFLKASKKSKFDTLVIGSSDLNTSWFVDRLYSNYFFKMAIESLSIKDEYIALKNYISIHPETKRVIVFVSYPAMFIPDVIRINDINNGQYTLNELIFLLLSKETTIKSIEKLKQTMRGENEFEEEVENQLHFFPNHYIYLQKSRIKYGVVQRAVEYLCKMVELFREKNIDYIFVIPPVHCIYQAALYDSPKEQKYVENIKKLLVNMSDNEVYDFTVLNKYTTIDYDSDNNYYWLDYVHPNGIIGYKMFKIIHGDKDEPELYQLLNKDNVEEKIANQKELLASYYKKNYDLIQSHIEKGKHVSYDSYKKVKYYEDGPEQVRNEYEEYRLAPKTMKLNSSTDHITKWK